MSTNTQRFLTVIERHRYNRMHTTWNTIILRPVKCILLWYVLHSHLVVCLTICKYFRETTLMLIKDWKCVQNMAWYSYVLYVLVWMVWRKICWICYLIAWVICPWTFFLIKKGLDQMMTCLNVDFSYLRHIFTYKDCHGKQANLNNKWDLRWQK